MNIKITTASDILLLQAKAYRKEAKILRGTAMIFSAGDPQDDSKLGKWLLEGEAMARELDIAAGLIEALVLGSSGKTN